VRQSEQRAARTLSLGDEEEKSAEAREHEANQLSELLGHASHHARLRSPKALARADKHLQAE